MPISGFLSREACLQRLLAVWVLAAPLSAAAIELPAGVLPMGGQTQAAASGAPASTATLEELSSRLESAREEHRQLLAQAPGSTPLLAERQLASASRLVLLSARVEAERVQAAASSPELRKAPSLTMLQGPPPYSAIDVDALRDHLEGLTAQQSALRLTSKSLDAEVEAAVAARAGTEANLRLRQEQSARGREGDEPGQMRAQVELAVLQAQVAELEVIQADAARRRARERLAALSEPISRLEGEIDRVRGEQRLDDADVEALAKELGAERKRLAAEHAKLAEQLARREAQATAAGPARARELEVMHHTMAALRELESLERDKVMLWKRRQEALNAGSDLGRRRAAAAVLSRIIEQVQARQRMASEQSDLLRAELRAQQSLIRGLSEEDPERAGEQRVHDALQVQFAVQERLHESLRRATVLLSRSRMDLGVAERPVNALGWVERAYAVAGDWAGTVWTYELFSATETTQIDGRVVTVEHGVTVGKSLGVLLMLVVGYWLAGSLSRLLVGAMVRRLHLPTQLARVLGRWAKSILLLGVLLIVLKMARIPLTAFAFLGGALAIGIGFGAQNVIKNLISGVIILFERKIRVGDIVSIGGVSGTVMTVDLRATTVRGFDGIDAIVPNSALLENQISNWSGGNPNVRRVIGVGVAYGSDVRKASQLVVDCAVAHPSVLPDPAPEVLFDDFGSDALTLRLLYWIRLGGPRGGPTVDSDLRYAIDDALRAAGIGVAFPQRDVHLDVAGPLRVELVRDATNPTPPSG